MTPTAVPAGAATPYYELKDTLLRVENVSQTLGGNLILRDVNIEIKDIVRPGREQGQVVGLLGPSGIGKTRLFRILAGLDAPDTGRVHHHERGVPVQRGMVGVVAQNYPLFHHRNVLGNLLVAGRQGRPERRGRPTKAKTCSSASALPSTAPSTRRNCRAGSVSASPSPNSSCAPSIFC
jgi:ABC-type sulfate/molybdate transport systems ATPase subunit